MQRYADTQIPSADRQDLAHALTSDDPISEIDQQISNLNRLERLIAIEKTKWERTRYAAELVTGGGEPSPEADEPTTTTSAAAAALSEVVGVEPDAAVGDEGAASADDRRPPSRRDALLQLFREDPSRVWRTRELVQELFDRQWNTAARASEANSASRLLGELEQEQLVEKLRKGQYKLRPPSEEGAQQAFTGGAT